METGTPVRRMRFSREAKLVTLLTGAVLGVWLIARVGPILGPFLWAAITAYIFTPVVDWLEARTRLRRIWVVILLYLVGLAVTVWAGAVFVPLVMEQVGGLMQDLPRILVALLDKLVLLDEYLETQGITIYGLSIDRQMLSAEIMRNVQGLVSYVTSRAIPAVFNVLEAVGQVLLYLVATFYLMRTPRGLRRRATLLVPREYRQEALQLLGDMDRVLGAYIRGQLLLIGIMALATFVALSILHVKYALIIALVSGVLEVIPLFGPFMAGGIAVSIALFQPSTPFGWSNLTLALAIVVVYVVLRQIEDQLVVPNLIGPIVDLHPLLVLLALLVGGTLAGFTGLVIAVPTAAALKIVVLYLYGKIWDEPPLEDLAPTTPLPATIEETPAAGETP